MDLNLSARDLAFRDEVRAFLSDNLPARLAEADLYRRTGKVDKAADAYRQAAEDANLPLPRDYALHALATLLEDNGRLAEARAAYQRLVAEFPTSVYASDARSRAAYLETAATG